MSLGELVKIPSSYMTSKGCAKLTDPSYEVALEKELLFKLGLEIALPLSLHRISCLL